MQGLASSAGDWDAVRPAGGGGAGCESARAARGALRGGAGRPSLSSPLPPQDASFPYGDGAPPPTYAPSSLAAELQSLALGAGAGSSGSLSALDTPTPDDASLAAALEGALASDALREAAEAVLQAGGGGSGVGAPPPPPAPPTPSRTVVLSGLSPGTTDADLEAALSRCGDLRTLYTGALQSTGAALAAFYDVRAAALAARALGTVPGPGGASRVVVEFAASRGALAGDDGARALFPAAPSEPAAATAARAAAYGDVRTVMDAPGAPGVRVVEFFDSRGAAAARRAARGAAPGPPGPSVAVPPIDEADTGTLRAAGSAASLYGVGSVASGGSGEWAPGWDGGVAPSAVADLAAALGGRPRFEGDSAASSTDALLFAGGSGALPRTGSAASLDGCDPFAPSPGSFRPGARLSSFSTGNLADLGGAGGGSIWGAPAGSSPAHAWPPAPWASDPPPPPFDPYSPPATAPSDVAAAYAAGAAAASHAAASLLGARAAAAAAGHGAPVPGLSPAAAAMLLARAQAAAGLAPLARPLGARGVGGNASAPALRGGLPAGGRLSRRGADPAADAERRAAQERAFTLDLGRVLSGADPRTTLMVRGGGEERRGARGDGGNSATRHPSPPPSLSRSATSPTSTPSACSWPPSTPSSPAGTTSSTCRSTLKTSATSATPLSTSRTPPSSPRCTPASMARGGTGSTRRRCAR